MNPDIIRPYTDVINSYATLCKISIICLALVQIFFKEYDYVDYVKLLLCYIINFMIGTIYWIITRRNIFLIN
jgi:hypothetical protein